MLWNIKKDIIADSSSLFPILLENRGLDESFIRKYQISDLPDPMSIVDMDKCVERIERAITSREKIFIHGDFDVDGTAATATLWSYLYKHRKADVMPYIPHRVDEGYGMTKKTIDKLIAEGTKLIISVDCGIKDIELVEYAKENGVDIIISDHHEFVHDEDGKPVLPKTIVIHGMHPDSINPIIICGGVTAWMIVCALEKKLNSTAYNETTLEYLDLAAITTLSDIMPLKSFNRVIVSLGLEKMRQKRRLGIEELCKIAQIVPESLDTYHIGFILGPRLNAPGRVENSAINSLRILCTDNLSKAKELAQHLDNLNKQRQGMTEKYIKEMSEQIEFDENNELKDNVIICLGVDMPEGIVGLVAGKLAERYYRPTFVMSHNTHENKVTGSARSIKNFHLVKALDECKEHMTRYGGHYMAAGFSLDPLKTEDFKQAVKSVANKILTKKDIIPELSIDCLLSGNLMSVSTVEKVKDLSPFGYGNTTPVFASRKVRLIDKRLMGNIQQHLKLTFNIDGNAVEGISFNCKDEWKHFNLNETFDIAYTLDINEWNNKKTVQLQLKDIKPL